MNKTFRATLAAVIVAILLPTLAFAAYNRGGLLALTDNIKLADNRTLFFGDSTRGDNPAVGDIAFKWNGAKLAVTGSGAIDPDGSAYLQLDAFRRTIAAYTANHTCAATESGYVFSNTGATESVGFTLPAVATSTGLTYEFELTADATVSITAPADKLVAYKDPVATALTFVEGSVGNKVSVVCDGAKWIADVDLAGPSATYSITP